MKPSSQRGLQTLIVETAVWPIPFLINMFTALKGSHFYFYLQNDERQDCSVRHEHALHSFCISLANAMHKFLIRQERYRNVGYTLCVRYYTYVIVPQ